MRPLLLVPLCLIPVACRSGPQPVASPEAPCATAEEAGRQIGAALKAARDFAARGWPEWTPGGVPVRYEDDEGRKWLFFGVPASAAPDTRCATEIGPARLLAAAGAKPSGFRASGGAREGVASLEISSPATAGFSALDWAAIFAHESFHCFQATAPQWRDRFRLAPEGSEGLRLLAELYREDSAFRRDIDEVLRLARSLLAAPDDRKSMAALLDLRRRHRDALARRVPALDGVEAAAEIIEGTARFVEYSLGPEPAREQAFEVSEGKYYYATGYALSLLLERQGVGDWRADLPRQGFDALLSLAAFPDDTAGRRFDDERGQDAPRRRGPAPHWPSARTDPLR